MHLMQLSTLQIQLVHRMQLGNAWGLCAPVRGGSLLPLSRGSAWLPRSSIAPLPSRSTCGLDFEFKFELDFLELEPADSASGWS
jgi:hypothetical protein